MLNETEKQIAILLNDMHNKYLEDPDNGYYDTRDILEAIHEKIRPNGAVSGFSRDIKRNIEPEWLLDYYWYTPVKKRDPGDDWRWFNGLGLACEIEWSYPTNQKFNNLLEDFQKLMVVNAEQKLFVTQLKALASIDDMVNWLAEFLLVPGFECLFIVTPVHNRKNGNELIVYKVKDNAFHLVNQTEYAI